MKTLKLFLGILIIATLTCACTPANITQTQIALTETATPINYPQVAPVTPSVTAAVPVAEDTVFRIRMKTTSDWTDLSLASDTDWRWQQLVSTSPEASVAEIQDKLLVLNQPIERAESGGSVEIVADVLFSLQRPGVPLVFTIRRGNLGYTRVDVSRLEGEKWVVVNGFEWNGISDNADNSSIFPFTSDDFLVELTVPDPSDPTTSDNFITGMTQGAEGYSWWNDCVFYELSVRSFYDSNGDGIGDFKGLIQKLDYLNDGDPETTTDLGVTGIWLRPINPSTAAHGYAVTDYYAVNPQFGTMTDFKRLLDDAHSRGIRVIVDLVLNHSSSQHPWFQAAADPASKYYDWYIWSDTDPGYNGSWGQKVWFPMFGRFFYSTFSVGQPDLNYTNPEVTAEMYKVATYWLADVGVDGFRLDAAKHIIEEGTIQADSQSTHEWYEEFRPIYKAVNPDALVVGELWEPVDIQTEYLQGDELDMAFDFYLAFSFAQAVKEEDATVANENLELSFTTQPTLNVGTFLTNYDIDRLMTQFDGNPEKVKVAYSMMLTTPGTPFIYYGEEVGLEGTAYDYVRRPMQWSEKPNAGFSTGTPWLALGDDWQTYNVDEEIDSPDSILSHIRALIHARNQQNALRAGDLSVVTTDNNHLYSILRISQDEAVLVLVNLSGESIADYGLTVDFSALFTGTYSPSVVMGEGDFTNLMANENGGFSGYLPKVELAPYETVILSFHR